MTERTIEGHLLEMPGERDYGSGLVIIYAKEYEPLIEEAVGPASSGD